MDLMTRTGEDALAISDYVQVLQAVLQNKSVSDEHVAGLYRIVVEIITLSASVEKLVDQSQKYVRDLSKA